MDEEEGDRGQSRPEKRRSGIGFGLVLWAGWGATYCSDNERGHTLTCILQREGKEEDKRRVGNITFRIYMGNMKKFFSDIPYISRNVWGMQGELTVCVVAVPKTDRCTQNPIALIKGDTRSRSSAKKGERREICHTFVHHTTSDSTRL